MKSHAFIALTLLVIAICATAGEPTPYADNLLDEVTRPTEKQNLFIKNLADKLAKSQVPSRDEADQLALGSFLKKPGLDAREKSRVAGLYLVGREVEGFAREGDLVWEVRISRLGSGVAGIVWVSTTTKKVKILFPN